MTPVTVYDDTALTLLFTSITALPFRYWNQADQGDRIIVFPTCAITAASSILLATENDWRVFLDPPAVHVGDLTTTAAIRISRWSGDFATRHVVYEQQTARGSAILTAAPGRYAGLGLPILPV